MRFRRIQKEINLRKEELMSLGSTEENTGIPTGGISKPTESIIMKWASDVTLKNMEVYQTTVDEFRKTLTNKQLELFNLRWLPPVMDWEEIADHYQISTATIYRRRKNLLEAYAHLKGII